MKRSMSRRRFVGGAAAVAVGAGAVADTQARETPSRDGGAVSKARAVITDFGAKGDGRNLNTKAIQAAVDACAARGGGTVVVPPGDFSSGTVVLKSRTTLYLAPGAVLRGSGNLADYLSDWTLALAYGRNRPLMGRIIGLQPAAVRAAPDSQAHSGDL
jgi:polygalacturonase